MDRRNRSNPGGRVYYDHNGVGVTTRWLLVDGRRYAVPELRNLRTCRGPFHPFVTSTALVAGAFLFMVAVGFPFFYRDPVGWIGVVAVATVPVGMALAALRLRPRAYELWAEYRGETVLLFRSPDVRTYGQVTRALVRAAEASRAGPAGEGAGAP